MGQKENKLKNKILDELPANMRMFRTNSGMAWIGESTKLGNDLVIRNPRPFHGMPEGFPDMAGWTETIITPDMVGKKVAIFTAYELKATGRLTKLQRSFRKVLESMGGIFKIIKE